MLRLSRSSEYNHTMVILADKLREQILKKRVTLLGVGPMSRTVTDAAVKLANVYRFPIALIPSRRQVDASEFGGGYVESWTTETFSKYVRSIDRGGFALLSRDHSGPWQGLPTTANSESDPTLPIAMQEVQDSLGHDIDCGFDFLHIDPSLALSRGFSESDVDDMVIELIAYCVSRMKNSDQCIFEIGTDEQDAAPDPLHVSRQRLERIIGKLKHYHLPLPLFYVVQTGTKVAETRNVGSFDQPLTVRGSLPATVHIPAVLQMCLENNVLLKEHNADYLSDEALRWHRKFGIHAANVAPEFGVTETRSLMGCMTDLSMISEAEEFKKIVLEGRRWEKWLLGKSNATDELKVEIAGHYHFADPKVREIRDRIQLAAKAAGYESEERISSDVSAAIDRYLKKFGYVGHR